MHHYQQRGKWLTIQRQLEVDDMVLIMEELTPPTKWPLGRVTALHPGKDGLVRVVDVKTATSQYRRALDKLIRLPLELEESPVNQGHPDAQIPQDSQDQPSH